MCVCTLMCVCVHTCVHSQEHKVLGTDPGFCMLGERSVSKPSPRPLHLYFSHVSFDDLPTACSGPLPRSSAPLKQPWSPSGPPAPPLKDRPSRQLAGHCVGGAVSEQTSN